MIIILIIILATVGLLWFAYHQDAKAHKDKPIPVAAPRVPAKSRTGTKAKQAYISMQPSAPSSRPSLRRALFQKLMRTKYNWRNPLPRKERRELTRLEMKARWPDEPRAIARLGSGGMLMGRRIQSA